MDPVFDRDGRTLRQREQREALLAARFGDTFEIAHIAFQRQVVLHPIGQPAATGVVPDQVVVCRQG